MLDDGCDSSFERMSRLQFPSSLRLGKPPPSRWVNGSRFQHSKALHSSIAFASVYHTGIDKQAFVIQLAAVVEIKKCSDVRKVADLGKPGTANHVVVLEVKVDRREAFKIVVPFLLAAMALNVEQHE